MSNNFPANAGPYILPVERRLPQPDADATALVRLVTDPLTLDEKGKTEEEPTSWLLNRPHPLAPEAKIVRMYRDDGGVEVYSSDGKMFVRTFVPERVIRFCDEAMSEDTFVEFIEIAEEDEEDEEPEEPEEPELPEPAPAPAGAANGPSAAS
jgi:hypothetical protein